MQNLAGEWIDAPPIPGTFVINLGKGERGATVLGAAHGSARVLTRAVAAALESVTQGLARATSHRVLSPAPGSTPRYSIPFFQSISQEVLVGDHVLQCKPTFLSLL